MRKKHDEDEMPRKPAPEGSGYKPQQEYQQPGDGFGAVYKEGLNIERPAQKEFPAKQNEPEINGPE